MTVHDGTLAPDGFRHNILVFSGEFLYTFWPQFIFLFWFELV